MNIKKIAPLLLLIIFLSGILTEIILYAFNRPVLNSHWITTKRNLSMGVIGSDAALIDRSIFSGNQLNLSRWYGYQEFISRAEYDYDKIKFKLRLSGDSYVDFFFKSDNGKRSGIRFTLKEGKNSFLFEDMKNYEFGTKTILYMRLVADEWIDIELNLLESKLFVDGSEILINKKLATNKTKIGFRGSVQETALDDIELYKKDELVFHESFSNRREWIKIFVIHLVIIGGVTCLLFFTLSSVLKMLFIPSYYTVLMFLVFWQLYDFYGWSRRDSFVTQKYLFTDKQVNVTVGEKVHYHFTKVWGAFLGLDTDFRRIIKKSYISERIYRGPLSCIDNESCKESNDNLIKKIFREKNHCFKQVLLGGSQTIGAGAKNISSTFFGHLHKKRDSSGKYPCVLSVNLAVSGWTMEQIKNYYLDEYIEIKPDIIILNTSANDTHQTLRKPLDSFLEKIKEKEIPIIVLIEPLSQDFNNQYSYLREGTMKEITQKHKVLLLDFHAYITNVEASLPGIIWWDIVHFTDYGHQLAAEWLYKETK